MSIWHSEFTLEEITLTNHNTLVEHLDIKFTEIGDDFLKATMPVDHRTTQPAGLLHGGASVSLAETLGSMSAYLCVDRSKYHCVGVEINANHIKSVTSGLVTGQSSPIHIGRSSQVWEIKIYTAEKALVCISRITMAVVPVKS